MTYYKMVCDEVVKHPRANLFAAVRAAAVANKELITFVGPDVQLAPKRNAGAGAAGTLVSGWEARVMECHRARRVRTHITASMRVAPSRARIKAAGAGPHLPGPG